MGLRIVGNEFVPGKGWDFTRFGPDNEDLRAPGVHAVRCEDFPPSGRQAETATESRIHYFRQKVRAYAKAEGINHRVERLWDESGELVGVQVAFAELAADLPGEDAWQKRPRRWEWDPRRWPDGDGGEVDLVALGQVVEIDRADYGGNFRRFRQQMTEIAKELGVQVEIRQAYTTKRREDGTTKDKASGAFVRFRGAQALDPATSDFSPVPGQEYT